MHRDRRFYKRSHQKGFQKHYRTSRQKQHMSCKVYQYQKVSGPDEWTCLHLSTERSDLVTQTDGLINLDLFQSSSVDSDCSFFDIDTSGNQPLLLDLETDEEYTNYTTFSTSSLEQQNDRDKRRYKAWIGAKQLHLS